MAQSDHEGELETRVTRKPVRKPACIRSLPYRCRQHAGLLAIWAPELAGLAKLTRQCEYHTSRERI